MELIQASHQWATRPEDERYTSLIDLAEAVRTHRTNSKAMVLSNRKISAAPVKDDDHGIAVIGPGGNAVTPTHWAFGQLSSVAGAPASYLRKLPSPLAADCINAGLALRDVEEVGVLLHRNGGPPSINAVTGPNYGRIWNDDITRALVKRFGDGRTGEFRIPGEFGKQVEVTKANTTLYASDRDMFVFLADEERRIEIPNRRNGKSGSLARGFFVQNSEVGSKTLAISTFLFDYVCCNRIVWGAENVQQITIRHTSGAPDRWVEQAMPAIRAIAQGSGEGVRDLVMSAQAKVIGDKEKVRAFLAGRFTTSQAVSIERAHMEEEGRPIETLWDAATGVTAYAKRIEYQDERVDLERKGGAILKQAA